MEDGYLLDRWDHTAVLAAGIQHLVAVMANAWTKGGRKLKPVTFEQAHPFREYKPTGLKITRDNFHVLKRLAGAAMKRR